MKVEVEELWIVKLLNIKKIKIALNSYIIDIILLYIFQIYILKKYESKFFFFNLENLKKNMFTFMHKKHIQI